MITEKFLMITKWAISIIGIIIIICLNIKKSEKKKKSAVIIRYEELFIPKFKGTKYEFNNNWKHSNDMELPDMVKKYYDNRYPFTFDEFYEEIIKINNIQLGYPSNFSNNVYVSKNTGVIRPPFDIVLYIPVYEIIDPNCNIKKEDYYE